MQSTHGTSSSSGLSTKISSKERLLSASWLLSGRTLMIWWLCSAVGVVGFDVGGIVDVEPHPQLRDLYLFFPLSG